MATPFDSPDGTSSQSRQAYQPDATETLSLFVSLACISLMSMLFGRKTSATTWGSLNYARGLVVGLYVCSWLFSLMAAMLVQTNNANQISCDISVFICILLYAFSKILIYLFLTERVHVVTSIGCTRWNSKLYRLNLGLISPYLGILTLAIIYRNAGFDILNFTPSGAIQKAKSRDAAADPVGGAMGPMGGGGRSGDRISMGAVGPTDPRYQPFGGQGTYHGHHGGFPKPAEKNHNPLESHISVTVESYVEEYHQMRYGRTSESPEYR
ncbi:hypothetical protein BG004_000210, partial [Podila humilis]